MKKFLFTLIALLISIPSFAIESGSVLNLKTGNSYIIPLNNRPLDIENTNTQIVTVDAITSIESNDNSILITTIEEGIAYIKFKENEKTITIKLLIDDQAEQDKDLLILDKLKNK